MRTIFSAAFCGMLLSCSIVGAQDRAISDQQIVSILMDQDKAGYPGNCRCPDDTDRAGRDCGKRSAYIRPGGFHPLCYASDVTPSMISGFRSSSVLSSR